jgi:hypothetical protein
MNKNKLFLLLICAALVLMSSNSFAESQSIQPPTNETQSIAKPDSIDSVEADPQAVNIYVFGQYSAIKSSKALKIDLVFINGILISGLAMNTYIHYKTNDLKTKLSTYASLNGGLAQLKVYSDYIINAKPGETYYFMIKNNGRELTLLTKEEGEKNLKVFTEQNYEL